jgi:N6-adenosine-specific RNA methylase IME4
MAPLAFARGRRLFNFRSARVVLVRTTEILQPPHPFAGLLCRGYCAIAIDAPTHFRCRTALQVANWNSRRDVEKHYATMSFDELAALPLSDLAHPDGCHLFSWTSGPHLPKACELIERWSFKYSSIAFTWIKLLRSLDPDQFHLLTESDVHKGLGLTTRKQTEIVLLGRIAGASPKACARSFSPRCVSILVNRTNSTVASNSTARARISTCSRANADQLGTCGATRSTYSAEACRDRAHPSSEQA